MSQMQISLCEGDVFITVSGRMTTPFPRTNYKRESINDLNINTWLKENAMQEAEATNNDYMQTLPKALNPSNWSPSDSSGTNLYLFNQPDGLIGHLKVKD